MAINGRGSSGAVQLVCRPSIKVRHPAPAGCAQAATAGGRASGRAWAVGHKVYTHASDSGGGAGADPVEGKSVKSSKQPRAIPAKPGDSRKRPRRGNRRIVAIGASAGGIAALQRLLSHLPADFGAPVLVVLHLDPARGSNVAELLQRSSKLPVREAKDGERPKPGRVYVGKPDRHLELQGSLIRLGTSKRVRFSRPSVDRLFQSVAESAGEGAIGVVLSGSGSDGAEGILALKRVEGFTIAEDRSTAAYPSMPSAAVETGAVDVIAPVGQIAGILDGVVRGGKTVSATGARWQTLLRRLRNKFGTDFSGYKASTLRRRLEKRLAATGSKSLAEYLKVVDRSAGELENLHASFLIKVSAFFRDREAWQALRTEFVRPLVQRRGKATDIRVWSAGCATGEEAYSLAILFAEAFGDLPPPGFKVFATDVDEAALEVARRGQYSLSQLTGLTEAQRKRFFLQEGDTYQVRKELRKFVIFGRHDLLKDPPIAQLNLLACRNVLIYLGEEQKTAILARFGYALRPGGVLFLGKAEAPSPILNLLEPISARARLYRKSNARVLLPTPPPRGPGGAKETLILEAAAAGGREIEEAVAFQHLLVQSASVVLILVNSAKRIALWNHAAEAAFGLTPEEALNRPAAHLFAAGSVEPLAQALRVALVEGSSSSLQDVACQREGEAARFLDLDVIPLRNHGRDSPGALIVGADATRHHAAEGKFREAAKQLRKANADAARSMDNLQASNEELETLNEELQSSAEEQQTLNEELQSANEELETTNEELQSANEELATLNEEIRTRGEELERVSLFLRAILDNAFDAVISCDRHNKITFWSRAATKVFRLSEAQAVGEDLFTLVPVIDVPAVRAAIRGSLVSPRRTSGGELQVGGNRIRITVSAVSDRAGSPQGYVVAAAHLDGAANQARGTPVAPGSGSEAKVSATGAEDS